MTWLNATLAFALSMLLFATIVSMIVESMHRMFRLRRKGLEWMIAHVYTEVCTHRADLLPSGQSLQSFLDALTCNDTAPAPFAHTPGWWNRLITPRQLGSLTSLDFAERLARTDIGTRLRQMAETERALLINGLVQKFEYYGKGAATYFGQRAKALSVAVAIVLAFAANIDTFHLANAFLTSPQLTERLIAQSPTIETDFKVQSVRLEHTLADTSLSTDEKNVHLEDIQKQIAAAHSALSSLIAQGLPIGWDYYPLCHAADQDTRCTVADQLTPIAWGLSTLLAGLLIGLGGPFWFEVCSNLTSVLQIPRAERTDGHTATGGGATAPGSTKPQTPAEAFAAAILLETVARPSTGTQQRSNTT